MNRVKVFFVGVFILLSYFQVNLLAQKMENARPGLSLQFTAIENTGVYHYPINNEWFDSKYQFKTNNERLLKYRENIRRIAIVLSNPDSINLSIKHTAAKFLNEGLSLKLATWESMQKAHKQQKRLFYLKYDINSKLKTLKENTVYLLTYDDIMSSKRRDDLIYELSNIQLNAEYGITNPFDISKLSNKQNDNYYVLAFETKIVVVGSNERSLIYGASDLLSKIDGRLRKAEIDQHSMDELNSSPTLEGVRIANLWNILERRESETFLSQDQLFYNIYAVSRTNKAGIVYEKLAKMLAFYGINGVAINGYDKFFKGDYNEMLNFFTLKMKQYGIDTYVEVTFDYAENDTTNKILSFFKKDTNLKGMVFSSLSPYKNESVTFDDNIVNLANNIAGLSPDKTVVWRSESSGIEGLNTNYIKEGRIRTELIFKEKPQQTEDGKPIILRNKEEVFVDKSKNLPFSPVSVFEGMHLKSYTLHWRGTSPFANKQFSDEKADVAFMIYFYTDESKRITKYIDEKINSNNEIKPKKN